MIDVFYGSLLVGNDEQIDVVCDNRRNRNLCGWFKGMRQVSFQSETPGLKEDVSKRNVVGKGGVKSSM